MIRHKTKNLFSFYLKVSFLPFGSYRSHTAKDRVLDPGYGRGEIFAEKFWKDIGKFSLVNSLMLRDNDISSSSQTFPDSAAGTGRIWGGWPSFHNLHWTWLTLCSPGLWYPFSTELLLKLLSVLGRPLSVKARNPSQPTFKKENLLTHGTKKSQHQLTSRRVGSTALSQLHLSLPLSPALYGFT